jgi:hypothetical protein
MSINREHDALTRAAAYRLFGTSHGPGSKWRTQLTTEERRIETDKQRVLSSGAPPAKKGKPFAPYIPGAAPTKSIRIVTDRGASQDRFRKALMARDKHCIVTGKRNSRRITAAHILAVNACKDGQYWDLDNGFMLSEELHACFDGKQWTIDPDTWAVRIKSGFTDLGELRGFTFPEKLRTPACAEYFRLHNEWAGFAPKRSHK